MPHCIIDYSPEVAGQIDIDALIEAVHQGAMESDLFPEYGNNRSPGAQYIAEPG